VGGLAGHVPTWFGLIFLSENPLLRGRHQAPDLPLLALAAPFQPSWEIRASALIEPADT